MEWARSEEDTVLPLIFGRGTMFKKILRRFRKALNPKKSQKKRFEHSSTYWEDRYKVGGNSGAGSYGRLAAFKAEILNDFVASHHISTVVELGSGDGAQLALAEYPAYIGYDVSETAVEQCNTKFQNDPSKKFYLMPGNSALQPADLTLSLDVIYHLVEDDVFSRYMTSLFDTSQRYVIVYSSNRDETWPAAHVRHRHFTKWVSENRPDFKFVEEIENRYPFDAADQNETSFANFYIYERLA